MNIEKAILIANLTSKLSKDPTTKVGASLLWKGQIVSNGYNGMPRGFDDNSIVSRNKQEVVEKFVNEGEFIFFKYDIFEHAERNLMFNYLKYNLNTDSLMCMTSFFPSPEDARALISSGIKKVVVFCKKQLGYITKVSPEIVDSFYFKNQNKNENFYDFITVLKMFYKTKIDVILVGEEYNSDVFLSFAIEVSNNKKEHLNELNLLAIRREYKKYFKYNKSNRFFLNYKDLFLENGKVKQCCFIVKDDFSLVNIEFEEDLQELLNLGFDISCIRKALYGVLSRYINNEHTLIVTMTPCINCLYAIALAGIKNILVSNQSINANTNITKWDEELKSKEYLNILEKFNLTIKNI